MECYKCKGKVFVDRAFTDNKDIETYCILCGDRKFISRSTEFGKWLEKMEVRQMVASGLAS